MCEARACVRARVGVCVYMRACPRACVLAFAGAHARVMSRATANGINWSNFDQFNRWSNFDQFDYWSNFDHGSNIKDRSKPGDAADLVP